MHTARVFSAPYASNYYEILARTLFMFYLVPDMMCRRIGVVVHMPSSCVTPIHPA